MQEKCLEKKCVACSKSAIKYQPYDENDTVLYFQWAEKKHEIEIKGKKKIVKKVIKEEIKTTKKGLVLAFNEQLLKFACHVCNMIHQYKAVKQIKKYLRVDEVLLHMDFSENYNCKYTKEIQSMHFGGSRNQISLHTSVLYYNKEGEVKSEPFCTFSEDRKHNNVAICAHLTPVIKEIKTIVSNLNTVHFVSDGPLINIKTEKSL